MRRPTYFLFASSFLFASPLLAQYGRPAPQQAPIDALAQSYQSAYNQGRFAEAAANREQARALLTQTPVDDPQFANWAQRVSQLYEGGGFAAQARDVLEQALAKSAGLGESSPARIALLDAVSRSWEQDRNLLKAVSYLEQAVTAAEGQPQRMAQASPSGFLGDNVTGAIWFAPMGRAAVYRGDFSGGNNNAALYQRLFNLYRRLGRPQDAAAVLSRIATHMKNTDGLLASLYQQQGQVDEAAAIYKRQADQSPDAQQAASALQQMAYIYQGGQRYGDASAALQRAIGKIEASGAPDADSRSLGMRQQLANVFQQAGQTQAADEIYQQLMAVRGNQQWNMVTSYATFLGQTKRVDQAETLLKDYLSTHTDAQSWEQNNVLQTLADVEQASGKPQLAEEYRQRALATQRQPTPPSGEVRIAETLNHAREAVNAGKLDEGFNLAMQALDSASSALDRETAPWAASSVADALARKAPAKADEISRRIFALVESWSPATVAPLLNAHQSYARALWNQQRWSEFDQAVERYSVTLTTARGAGTGWGEDVLRLRINAGYQPERRPSALLDSQELVKLEESLSGVTSEPYLRAIETLANTMEASGDTAGALPFRRKIVTIADLVYGANDARRAIDRMNSAMAFARGGEFDEAEQLGREAVALGKHIQPQLEYLTPQLQQILQMKEAAQAASAPKR